MPAKSAAQKRLMDAAAHNPAFAKKVGIPSKVAQEYSKESKGLTFKKGTEMKAKSMKAIFGGKETKAEEKAERKAVKGNKAMYKKAEAKYEGEKMAKGGYRKAADGITKKGKTVGKMLSRGGKACK